MEKERENECHKILKYLLKKKKKKKKKRDVLFWIELWVFFLLIKSNKKQVFIVL